MNWQFALNFGRYRICFSIWLQYLSRADCEDCRKEKDDGKRGMPIRDYEALLLYFG